MAHLAGGFDMQVGEVNTEQLSGQNQMGGSVKGAAAKSKLLSFL